MGEIVNLEHRRMLKEISEVLEDLHDLTVKMALSSSPSDFEQEVTTKTLSIAIMCSQAEEAGVPEDEIVALINGKLGV